MEKGQAKRIQMLALELGSLSNLDPATSDILSVLNLSLPSLIKRG